MAFQTAIGCDEYRGLSCGKILILFTPLIMKIGFIKTLRRELFFCSSNSNNYQFNHIRAPNFLGNSTTYNQEWRKQQKKEPLDKKNNSKAKESK
jgi:hypothetical protein